MKTFLVRGVPSSIQQDGWWMDGLIRRPPNPPTNKNSSSGSSRMERPLLLIALVALADALLWGVTPGLSLFIFGLVVLVAALIMANGRGWGGVLLGAALFLPALEEVQTLSVLFWLAGLLMGGAWIAHGGWQGLRKASLGALRLALYGPLSSLTDLALAFHHTAPSQSPLDRLEKLMLGWALPLGLGLIFFSLLIEANPVAAHWLERTDDLRLPELGRVSFWLGMALCLAPFLRLTGLSQRLTPAERPVIYGPRRLPGFLNPDAVRRSLFLFNALFAVQTGLDAAYLWGGTSLPEGMSYATYAHRGAYPLLVTALLAGGFALVARPFTGTDRALRAALMFWIAQTVLLVISSLMRLELYIEVYGLTRLRLSAGIWMGVVATGLCLTLWQVLRQHSAAWLLKRCAILGLVALYLAMFVSFDRAIARYNLTHDVARDPGYICQLGPAALPEIRRNAPGLCDYHVTPRAPLITDWREWGFRDWRVLRSLAALNNDTADL